jgi:hypothetical protein
MHPALTAMNFYAAFSAASAAFFNQYLEDLSVCPLSDLSGDFESVLV